MRGRDAAADDWYASLLADWPSETALLLVGRRLNSRKMGCSKISVMLTTAEMSCQQGSIMRSFLPVQLASLVSFRSGIIAWMFATGRVPRVSLGGQAG